MRAAALLLALTLASPLVLALPETPVSYHGLGLVSGILETLAAQANVAIEVPTAPDTLRLVRVDLEGPFSEVLPAFVGEHLPGWKLEESGSLIRIVPAGKPPAATLSPKPLPSRPEARPSYFLVGDEGTRVPAPYPEFQPAVVVDNVTTLKGDVLEVELSLLGPTCLYFGQGTPVCLRPTAPGVEGTVVLDTPQGPLKVRYRTRSDTLALYRVKVRAPEPAMVRPAEPKKPEKPRPRVPQPLKDLGKRTWQVDPDGSFSFLDLRLSPAPEGTYYQLAAFRNPRNAVAFVKQRLGRLPLALKRKGPYLVVLSGPETPDRKVYRELKKQGLRFLVAR